MNTLLLRLLTTVACALLVSTVGPSATVSAEQIGRSPIYSFDVMHEGAVAGEVKVNTARRTPSYVLVVDGLTPNTNYVFGYSSTESEVVRVLGFADTEETGALRVHATFPLQSLRDLASAQFWVAETGAVGAPSDAEPYWDNQEINSVYLEQDGWFIAKLQFYFSEDGGLTWKWSKQTDNLTIYDTKEVWFADGWVPDGALVRIHAEVIAGKDRTDSRVFTVKYSFEWFTWANWQPWYKLSGTTGNPKLEYLGTIVWD